MAATNSLNNMQNKPLLAKLRQTYKTFSFSAGSSFYWSPANKTVYYSEADLNTEKSAWSLIHELSHGLLHHTSYSSDFELLKYEVEAWQKAREIAKDFGLKIDPHHVEECLNTYRDWLYARSTCPICTLNGIQTKKNTYKCLNCTSTWRVSPSRFCRPYRKKQKTPLSSTETVSSG